MVWRSQVTIVTENARIWLGCFYSDARACSLVALEVPFNSECNLLHEPIVLQARRASPPLQG
jgi:hypothetical protein